jgi:NTE family protein
VRRAGRLEAAHDLVLLVVEGASGFDALDNEFAWRVLAQVDLVVALCRDHTARRPGLVQAVERIERPHQVVLMRDVGCRPSVRGWDDVLSARRRNRGVGHLEHGSTHDLARLVRRLLGRSVGVALGGGGARGFAHIGALRALCEAGVQVDRVGGTSMGAVMGAQFAMGWAPERMLHENDGSWLRRSLADVHLPRVSLARGTRALALLESFFGDRRIEELALDFFCTTTNLSECRLHVARRGLVAHWVAASAAVPGIWPPLTDSAGHLHVDGGVLDNVPTDVMRDAEPGPVIAIDVCHRQSAMTVGTRQADGRLRPLVREPRRYVRERTPGLLDILSRCNMLASMQSLARAGEHADLYLTPDVEEFGFRAFQRVRELADVGYRSTMRQLEHADLSALTG